MYLKVHIPPVQQQSGLADGIVVFLQ